VCTVAGAGVEQPASGIPQKRVSVNFPEPKTFAQQWPQQQGRDQRAERDEDQGVGKVAVKFEVQQRIAARANQNIGIGHQGGSKTDYRRASRFLLACDR